MKTQELSYETLEAELLSQGVASLPIAITPEHIDHAIQSFFSFLNLPRDVKDPLYHRLIEADRGTEIGYRRRHPHKGDLDDKEYIHYNEYCSLFFKEAIDSIPEVRNLFSALTPIYTAAKTLTGDIIRTLDVQYPGLYDRYFPVHEPPRFYLRLLKYTPQGGGNFLAKGHYDRGGMTLAIAESAPGLRVGRSVDDLRLVQHTDGQCLFMPAIRFPHLTSDKFSPVWHDVVQLERDQYSSAAARWAIVFFADPVEMDIITFEEAHTPRYE